MPCQYCGDTHSAFDPCPESIAAYSATVQKHTLGTHDPMTLRQLEEAVRVVESLTRQSRWMLISPQGEMWAEHDPKKLVGVLLQKIKPSFPSRRPSAPIALSRREWEKELLRIHGVDVRFKIERGEGETYGEPGTITAHIGNDMQSDVVGVWVPGSHCSIDDIDFGVKE